MYKHQTMSLEVVYKDISTLILELQYLRKEGTLKVNGTQDKILLEF